MSSPGGDRSADPASVAVGLITHAPAETEALGRRLAAALRRGDVLALDGELGAGKTCLVRGIAAGLGADPLAVRSPTFVLHQVYRGRDLVLHHLDCYRLGAGADLRRLGLEDLVEDGAVAVEWAEYADLRGVGAVRVTIEPLPDRPDGRRISLSAGAPKRFAGAFAAGSRR